jgi:hypothetical protein
MVAKSLCLQPWSNAVFALFEPFFAVLAVRSILL